MLAEQIMGYTAISFGIIGSWGLYRQIRMIWFVKPRSADSVSGVWAITFLAMFAAFMIYGTQQNSFPMEFQGWLRVLFSVPVTAGFLMYGNKSRKHWLLIIVYAVLLSGMSVRSISPLLFLVFSFLGVWSSFVQAYTIKCARSRGKIAVELQIIYLAAILCWLIYGIIRHDVPLITVSVGFIMSYSSTIIMWYKYPR